MMLNTKTMVSSRSHCSRVNPTVSMKNPGITTRKPNIDEVLMMRTRPTSVTFGWLHMMVMFLVIDSSGFSPSGARRFMPCASRIPIKPTNPPNTTRPNESQKVCNAPIKGMAKLATSEPRVGSPAA